MLTGGLFYTLLVLLIYAIGGWPFTERYSILIVSVYALTALFQINNGLYRWYQWMLRSVFTIICFLFSLLFLFILVVAAANGGGLTGKINF